MIQIRTCLVLALLWSPLVGCGENIDLLSDLGAGQNDSGADIGSDIASADLTTDASPDTAPQHNCAGAVTESELCAEDTNAIVGTSFDVKIHIRLKPGCTEVSQVHGELHYDQTYFTLTSPQGGLPAECILRDTRTGHIYWHQFTEVVNSMCAAMYPAGVADTLTFDVSPTTPPGDYTFSWQNAVVGDNFTQADCRTVDVATNANVRIDIGP